MKNKTTILISLSCFLIALALLVQFNSSNNKKKQGDSDLTTLKVGAMPVAECALLGNKKVFEKYGLRLQISITTSGTQITDSVVGKGVDFGFSNLVTPIIATSNGISLKIIGPVSLESDARPRHILFCRRDSGITRIADLKGKMIAVNALRNIDHLMLLRLLDKESLKKEDVKFQVTAFPNMMASLTSKSVDAIALVEPFVTLARLSGNDYVELGNYFSDSNGGSVAVSGFLIRTDRFSAERDLAERLTAALNESATELEGNPVLFREFVGEFTKQKPEVLEKMPLPWYSTLVKLEWLESLAETARGSGFITKDVDVRPLIEISKER